MKLEGWKVDREGFGRVTQLLVFFSSGPISIQGPGKTILNKWRTFGRIHGVRGIKGES